jgi:Holliday junction DNA helicase RuvA
MIGYLKGNILSVKPTKVLLDVNGVGYAVNISINTFEEINNKDTASLFIHTSVREDSITLYGFFAEPEKDMFELLISISGIGPKLAQSILSGIMVDELKSAIKNGDTGRITAAPGVGRKTAERLVLELRSKVDAVAEAGGTADSRSVKGEAVSALTTLGYNLKVAEKAVSDSLSAEPDLPLEDLIKKALGVLNN